MNKNWIAAALIGLAIAVGGVALPATAVADSSWDSNPAQVKSQVVPANTAGILLVDPDNSPWD